LKTLIISHRFNPGHLSHIAAFDSLMLDVGTDVFLRINRQFAFKPRKHISFLDLLFCKKFDIVIILFPSILAFLEVLFLKFLTRSSIVYIYHEPLGDFQSYKKAGFSSFKTIIIYLKGFVSFLIAKLSDRLFFPSNNSYNQFLANSTGYPAKNIFLVNLLFNDESEGESETKFIGREYISYIGTIAEDHAFDEFINFTIYALNHNWFKAYKFLIATKSHISTDQLQHLDKFIRSGRVHIKSGKPLTNNEINFFYRNSLVVWNAYRRSMQSGVLPKAYMFGSPVIISSANLSEFFDNYIHGIVLSDSYLPQEIKFAIDEIIKNFERYSANCRKKFLTTFYYRAHVKKISDIFSAERALKNNG
jgi:hypothetical protein